MKNIINKKTYDKKYEAGYGIMYPEGHIIRFYECFLKYEYGITGKRKEKLFDFGCGNGTHSLFFCRKGFDVYGCDISKLAIEQAKQRCPSGKFETIESGQRINNLFGETRFDIIIANQSLYYLDDSCFQSTLEDIYDMLVPGGLVYFTMMGTKSYYYDCADTKKYNGLQKVTLTGRLNETSYIRFINNEKELMKIFNLWDCLWIGFYSYSKREGASFHWQFLGRKSKVKV